MLVLLVGIQVVDGEGAALEQVFHGPFKAAITAQPGFKAVSLLRPDDGGDYLLAIAFADQAQQQQWVATDLHNQVWAQMESHFEGYSLRTFTAV